MRFALVLVLAPAVAAAAPPAKCNVSFRLDKVATDTVTGKVAKIAPAADRGVIVTLDKLAFGFVSDLPLAFKAGDTIHVRYRCGGPPPGIYCDASIADANGKVLAISSQIGSDDFSDGWRAKPGKITASRQDSNAREKSIDRTHELVLAKGKVSVAVTGGACTEIKDGATTWYATGSAHSWDGIRPPEGIDYQMYAMTRAP